MNPVERKYLIVEDTKIHYLIAGQGEPILFIHGFPTSSYLWRDIMKSLQDKHKVIAIDLPGYGASDKKIEDSYSFRYYARILNSFLSTLKLDKITLGVHDVGGPIGLYWMVQNMERVNRLILFNTIVYSNFSWAVKLFGLATITPLIRNWITSKNGIKKALQIGVYKEGNLTKEIIEHYQKPFKEKTSRKALLKSVQRLSMNGFKEIEEKIVDFKGPVQIIYGENDKILPNVRDTMNKVKKSLPQSTILSIPNCGHFLQEEYPDKISETILEFMKS